VRGDVRDDPGLAGGVRGMPCCPTKVSRGGHCMAGRRASLGHLHLVTHPGPSMLDRLTRSRVFRPSRLEQVKDVLRARCRPKSEELVIRISEGSHRGGSSRSEGLGPSGRITAGTSITGICSTPRRHAGDQAGPTQACKPGGRSSDETQQCRLAWIGAVTVDHRSLRGALRARVDSAAWARGGRPDVADHHADTGQQRWRGQQRLLDGYACDVGEHVRACGRTCRASRPSCRAGSAASPRGSPPTPPGGRRG
jgi:hypothetical protein